MGGNILHRSCLFSTLELLSIYKGYLRNLLEAWKGNTDASQSEAGDQGSLSTCHSDIGIPINFQKSQGSSPFEALKLHTPRGVKVM